MDDVDVNGDLHIRQMVWPFVAIGLFFGLTGFVLAWGTWIGLSAGDGTGWLAALFGAGAIGSFGIVLFCLNRARHGRAVAITLSPDGYHDRFSRYPHPIPWTGIKALKLYRGRGAHLRVTLSEEWGRRVDEGGTLSVARRLSHMTTRPILATATNFLEMRPDNLLAIAERYALAHGARGHENGS